MLTAGVYPQLCVEGEDDVPEKVNSSFKKVKLNGN